jgi:threonine aldolase
MIDLRSDTVTKPGQAMRKAMYEAEVGDDVYREDPTVIELEEFIAALFSKEAALFVSSGVMGNQLCLNILTQPHDEVICEKESHIFHYESGSPAALSGLQLYPVAGQHGVMDIADVRQAIRPLEAYYMPRTQVIAIENTHNRASGAIQPMSSIKEIKALADEYNLRTHLDGARIWNASAATGIPLFEYAPYFDTISACFSKGLGAPAGSIILGSKAMIEEAFRIRKSWGGGMRQIGILAAAALFAVKNNFGKLKEDHEKARMLAEKIASLPDVIIDLDTIQTNMVIFEPRNKDLKKVISACEEKGLRISMGTTTALRAVTHLDVSFEDIETAGQILEEILTK